MTVNVAVARNAEEAERILRGENVTVVRDEDEDEAVAGAAECLRRRRRTPRMKPRTTPRPDLPLLLKQTKARF